MPLVYRAVGPVKLSSAKLELKGKSDSEFIAVNNETLVNVLRQLASIVTHAGDIFSDVASLTQQVSNRVRSVKLRLDELEAKADLFDPRLVPVPEGTLDDVVNSPTHRLRGHVTFDAEFITKSSRPRFLIQLYERAGKHDPVFPPRSPILASQGRRSLERQISLDSRRPASFAALRDWKLDDYLDEKIATLDRKKQSAEELNRALASPFPSQVVQVDVTGAGFDRMKANRRSLVIHTKKIRRNKRRNTICGSMPNKECGIQTSFTSVASPGGTGDDEDGESHPDNGSDESHRHHQHHHHKKYGIDSGHWSSCTSSAQGVPGVPSSSSAPSPWDPNSLSTSSDFLFDDEDRCLTPQLENFTDGLVSDSDSVDTDGYFTSFRSDCGFPRVKKSASTKELGESKDESTSLSSAGMLESPAGTLPPDHHHPGTGTNDRGAAGLTTTTGSRFTGPTIIMNCSGASSANTTVVAACAENEYELFGKGSTSTTASSCGTVVLRSKPDPPVRTISSAPEEAAGSEKKLNQNASCGNASANEDAGLEERVKRKSLIERVPSMVVVTPSPSCSSASPPPLKDPGTVCHHLDDDSEHDSGRITPKPDDLFTTNESECGTLSDTDSDRRTEVRLSDIAVKKRSTSSTSSTGTASTSNSTLTLTSCALGNPSGLPQPDVIPDAVQQLQIIRTTKPTPKLDTNKEYYSLDTVLLGSFQEEHNGKMNHGQSEGLTTPPANSNPVTTNGLGKNLVLVDGREGIVPTNNNATMTVANMATSGKIRGARVVLDANGEIIFSSETLRRKRKQKVSFDPGSAVKSPDYDSNSTYARVRESVYDRIRKEPNDPEKLYECIEEIRRHNLQARDPFLEVHMKGPADGKEGERCVSSASAASSSSSPSKACSTPDPHAKLLETDLDSAIPPVMPDLKNLPKIKDRLKRNESYRIANTDDVPPPNSTSPPGGGPKGKFSMENNKSSGGSGSTTPSRSPLSPLHLNRNGPSSKRMSLTSPPTSNGSTPLHLNKKRDIPEEDPNFIQQIFSMNSAANSQLHSPGSAHNGSGGGLLKSPLDSLTSRITLSKFTLSSEDRPSFLRRDSPPTMDEIAKEIYRFRKKFNIQPNAATTTLTRSQQVSSSPSPAGGGAASLLTGSLRRPPPPLSSSECRAVPRSSSSIGNYLSSPGGNTLPRSVTTSSIKSTIPAGFPKLSVEPSRGTTPTPPAPAPFNTSTPVRRPASSCHVSSNPSPAASPIYYPAYGWTGAPPPYSTPNRERMMTPTVTPNRTVPPVPPTRAFGSGRKIFPLKPSTPSSVHSFNYPPNSISSVSNVSSSSITPPRDNNPPPRSAREQLGLLSPTPLPTSSNNNNSNSSSNSIYRKSISLLPSLPFRRNSVAFAEPSSSTGKLDMKPRTSLGEFKRLLQATQKKRSSISAVEVLKPKGLETTL